jgi:uncharacterized surface protein with fasciclin (FAS1) repeats
MVTRTEREASNSASGAYKVRTTSRFEDVMLSRLRMLATTALVVITLSLSVPARADAPGTIVDVASGAGTFKTLVAAVKAAGLADTLSGKGPFTVFAPTDAAFAKLPAGTVDSLLKPENKKKLQSILLYHVVAGKVLSTDLKAGPLKTVEGGDLTVDLSGGTVKINDATVTKADIPASNGVIHVIDTVLLPK